jgi:hypothetical protein
VSSEDGLWKTMRDKVGVFLCLHRVENSCEKGTPDVAWAGKIPSSASRCSGWLELKHGEWPAKPTTPLNIPKLYLEQVQWQEEWHEAGGKVATLIQVDRDYLFVSPMVLRLIYERRATQSALQQYIIGSKIFPTTQLIKSLILS